jgi:hypothetical protein
MNSSDISIIISVGLLVFTAYKTITEARRGDIDIYTKAAAALIEPLERRITKLTLVQTRLVQAIDDYLTERAVKLKANPYCGACLGADMQFRSTVQAIIQNGDAEKTKPVKENT